MNGISLLLLLTSVGVTTSVETGANNQSVYTIRIESVLINELRAGRSIPILVAPRDRRIRKFKIAMTPDSTQRGGTTARASDTNAGAGDFFDYEPTLLENGEIEYVVQMSPDRLESLAKGRVIEGDIAPNIDEVHQFLIFVGIGELPSQQQAALAQQQGARQQPPVTLAGNSNPPSQFRGAEVRAAPANNTQPNSRYPNPEPPGQFNNRGTETRTHWRNHPDQSTINPPPFTNTNHPTAPSGNSYPRAGTTPSTNDRNAYNTQPNYNNTFPQSNYPDPNGAYAHHNNNGYGANPGTFANNQGGNGQPTYPPNQGQTYGPQQQFPQQPMATVTARNDVPAANGANVPATSGWNQPAATTPTAAPPAAATTLTTAAVKAEVEKDRPWTPLILTTLALFASLGANAYLGWLAWSFFWRFRDAVTESARTRAQMSSNRQAA